jgi:hypothetical protein
MRGCVIEIALLIVRGGLAYAGDCHEGGPLVAAVEAYARKPGTQVPELSSLCMEQGVVPSKPLAKRLIAACDVIVAREASRDCVYWSTVLGAKQLGGKEMIDQLAAQVPLDPFHFATVEAYEKLDDPRAVPLVVAAWQAGLADKRAKKAFYAEDLARWRHAGARILGKHGGAAERAFLDDQVQTLGDRGVKKACRAASAAIAKRLATP